MYTNSCGLLTLRPKCAGHATLKNSILGYVIHKLIHGTRELVSTYDFGNDDNRSDNSTPLTFRLCMANVLISACQKLSDSQKKRFAQKILPHLIGFVEVILLFSYH